MTEWVRSILLMMDECFWRTVPHCCAWQHWKTKTKKQQQKTTTKNNPFYSVGHGSVRGGWGSWENCGSTRAHQKLPWRWVPWSRDGLTPCPAGITVLHAVCWPSLPSTSHDLNVGCCLATQEDSLQIRLSPPASDRSNDTWKNQQDELDHLTTLSAQKQRTVQEQNKDYTHTDKSRFFIVFFFSVRKVRVL